MEAAKLNKLSACPRLMALNSYFDFGQKWLYFGRRQMARVAKVFPRPAAFDARTSATQVIQKTVVTDFHEFEWIAMFCFTCHFCHEIQIQLFCRCSTFEVKCFIHSKWLERTPPTSKQCKCAKLQCHTSLVLSDERNEHWTPAKLKYWCHSHEHSITNVLQMYTYPQ